MTQTAEIQTPVPFLPTVPQVNVALLGIEAAAHAGNYAEATRLERRMMTGVLEAIASGNAQAGYLAAAALDSTAIDFPRTAL